jgi:transcriptional regulator with XRE-family HTH domain
MAEQDLQPPQAPLDDFVTVGARLRRAREEQGLSRADIAARTKIAERHLAAIEEERFADLASSTYAVGFSRAYARAVGLDERKIAQAVRGEIDHNDMTDAPSKPTFEPGDPARVPSSRMAWLAGVGVLIVIACLAVFWGSYYFPAVSLPDLIKDTPRAPVMKKKPNAPAPAAPTAPMPQGPVMITAREAGVWVKVSDETGKALFQKQMALGETYTIPPDARGPKLRTAWPDALAITIGGQPVPPLSDKRLVLTAPISAAALLARGTSASPSPNPAAPPVVAAPVPAAQRPAATNPAPGPSPSSPAPSVPGAANSPVARRGAVTPKSAAPVAPPAAAAPIADPAPAQVPAPVAEAPKASTVSQ